MHWELPCVGEYDTGRCRFGDREGTTLSYARISVCGVVEYPCAGTCSDYIREHEAVWILESGKVAVTGGQPYCPACAAALKAGAEEKTAA